MIVGPTAPSLECDAGVGKTEQLPTVLGESVMSDLARSPQPCPPSPFPSPRANSHGCDPAILREPSTGAPPHASRVTG